MLLQKHFVILHLLVEFALVINLKSLLKSLVSRNSELSLSEKEELTMIRQLIPNIGDALIRHCFSMLLEKLQ